MAGNTSGNRRWLIARLVLAVIVVATALSFGGHHEKAPDPKSLSRTPASVTWPVLL